MTKVLTIFLILAPGVALACPVCFGQSDAPMAKAMNLGIFAMLVVVAGMLASFASFVVYLMRRARLADLSGVPASGGNLVPPTDPQEGIAQC